MISNTLPSIHSSYQYLHDFDSDLVKVIMMVLPVLVSNLR
jgi:hypothetical protein